MLLRLLAFTVFEACIMDQNLGLLHQALVLKYFNHFSDCYFRVKVEVGPSKPSLVNLAQGVNVVRVILNL